MTNNTTQNQELEAFIEKVLNDMYIEIKEHALLIAQGADPDFIVNPLFDDIEQSLRQAYSLAEKKMEETKRDMEELVKQIVNDKKTKTELLYNIGLIGEYPLRDK